MKKLLMVGLALVLGACSTLAGGPQVSVQQRARVIAQACPGLGQTVRELQALNLPVGAQADLAKAYDLGAKVCQTAATVASAPAGTAQMNFSDLQAVNTQAVPLLISVIKSSSLSPTAQNAAILDVMAAQIIVQGALNAAQGAGA